MTTSPLDRVAGLLMTLGAALMLVIFFIRPGSVLLPPDPERPLLGMVNVLANHAALTHVSALVGSLAILMVLFGFFTLRDAVGRHTTSDAFIRFGVLMLTVAVVGFVLAAGLNHIIAHLVNHGTAEGFQRSAMVNQAVHVQSVKSGIRIISSYAYLLGYFLVALGLFARFSSGLLKGLALAVAVIALAGTVVLAIGDHIHTLGFLYRVAALAVLPLHLWVIVLGATLYNGHAALAPTPGDR